MTVIAAARCIFFNKDKYFLVQHNTYLPEKFGKWGLPGGHIKPMETPDEALRREMFEEFAVNLDEIIFVGDWLYRNQFHRVFASHIGYEIYIHDTLEVLKSSWYTYEQIKNLDRDNDLHTEFELAAIDKLRGLLRSGAKND
ncbi:NUDIX hydrolase [Candidatus Saccharibacteria bacterium]|nr:NUDIX hydrolase [Candidatus Saccharibacteria bacterium]